MTMTDELTPEEVEALFDDPAQSIATKEELSLEDLDFLDTQPEPTPTKTPRRKKDPTGDRSILGWMALIHNFEHECTVPLHDEERPRKKGAHYQIGDLWVCRICYINELDKLVE